MPGEQTTRAEPGANPVDRDLKRDPFPVGNTEKDRRKWVSGGEPMTGAQAPYLKTLSDGSSCQWCADFLAAAPAHLN